METNKDYKCLFQPLKINDLEIKNRIVMSPMALGDADPRGYPTEQTAAFYAARARGGVGLIVLGGTVASTRMWDESPFSGVIRVDIDDTIPAFKRVVDAVHAFDTRIFCELAPSFGRMGSARKSGLQPVAATGGEPLVIPTNAAPKGLRFLGGTTMETPREISASELVGLEDEMAQAASRAKRAGFDGIEIACMMSYLLASFLTPRVNRRTDMYGGDLENRMRFLVNIVRKTRDLVGPDFPVGVKLICNEHVEGGLAVSEYVKIGVALEREGVDYLSLADGCYEAMEESTPSTHNGPVRHGEPQAFKEAVKIPIMVPCVHLPHLAVDAVERGYADGIVLGRPLIADPAWAEKTREARVGDITQCDFDNYCILRLMLGMAVHCKRNPEMGREAGAPDSPPSQRLKERSMLFIAGKPRLMRLAVRSTRPTT